VTSSGERPFWKNGIANIPILSESHSSEALGDADFSRIKHITFRFIQHVLSLVSVVAF